MYKYETTNPILTVININNRVLIPYVISKYYYIS